MGDVAQSITYFNGKYFVVLNGSAKIEVVEPETFKSVGTILFTRKKEVLVLWSLLMIRRLL